MTGTARARKRDFFSVTGLERVQFGGGEMGDMGSFSDWAGGGSGLDLGASEAAGASF